MATEKKTKPRGAQPIYNAKFHPMLAKAFGKMGMGNAQIAIQLGVGERTVERWRAEHPEFEAALKNGEQMPDDQVEAALFRRAVGLRYKAQKPMVVSDGKDMGSHVQIVEYEERALPDVTACIYWLKCRRPEKWRQDNPNVDLGPTLAILDKVLEGVKGELQS